jgi:hypothetical protein
VFPFRGVTREYALPWHTKIRCPSPHRQGMVAPSNQRLSPSAPAPRPTRRAVPPPEALVHRDGAAARREQPPEQPAHPGSRRWSVPEAPRGTSRSKLHFTGRARNDGSLNTYLPAEVHSAAVHATERVGLAAETPAAAGDGTPESTRSPRAPLPRPGEPAKRVAAVAIAGAAWIGSTAGRWAGTFQSLARCEAVESAAIVSIEDYHRSANAIHAVALLHRWSSPERLLRAV